jgi:uncharacterized protein
MFPLSKEIETFFKNKGIRVEVMNSKKAVSTYNVLVEENREIAAAFIPLTPVSAKEYNSPHEYK